MQSYVWETPEEINLDLAGRFSLIRKRRKISQERLAGLSGVSYGSIKRFERTGQISLLHLTRLAIALDCVDEIRRLFTEIPYKTIQEVVREQELIRLRALLKQKPE